MSFAILNADGEHLGFLLLAGHGDLGECIFRSFPTEPELLDTEPSQLLTRLQSQGEFEWKKVGRQLEVFAADQTLVACIVDQQLEIEGLDFRVIEL